MRYKSRRSRCRRGATLVEMALVAPVTLLLLLGIIVGGIVCFRAQQMQTLASEGARWAALHGPKYAKQHGRGLPTNHEIFTKAMQPLATSLSPDQLTYDVQWDRAQSKVVVDVRYQFSSRFFGRVWNLNARSESPLIN
jgi:Flp pilus assembly protein TadG